MQVQLRPEAAKVFVSAAPQPRTRVGAAERAYVRRAMADQGYLSKQKAARRFDVSEKTIDRLRG